MTTVKLGVFSALLAMLWSPAVFGEDQAVKRTPPRAPAPSGQAGTPRSTPPAQAPPRTPSSRPGSQAAPRTAVPRTPGERAPLLPYYRYRPYVYGEPGFNLGFYYGMPYYHPDYSPYWSYQVYGYPVPNPYYGSEASGSVRLEIPQKEAEVYVDGYFVGDVDDFDGPLTHLELPVGPHRIEVKAPGYQTLTIEVFVQPGRMIRYRGSLQPNQT